MKKILFISLIAAFVSCKKDFQRSEPNRFEISFIASDFDQIKNFTIFVAGNAKTFYPVKEVMPVGGKDVLYKVEFEIPDTVSGDELQFYIQETRKDGEKINSEIVPLN